MKLTINDLADFVRGAAFFGTGGGGDPYIGRLMLEQEMKSSGSITIIEAGELADDAFVIPVFCMGAPTVMTEKLPNIRALEKALRKMEELTGRSVDAIIPLEIGGINSTLPLILSAKTGIPVVNADGMGRAFPEIQMVTFGVYGCAIAPVIAASEQGDMVVVYADDNKQGEDLARSAVIRMGGAAQVTCYPMSGEQVKRTCVPNTLFLALEVGRSIRVAHEKGKPPFDYLFNTITQRDAKRECKILFDGKVMDIERQTQGGFNIGKIIFQGIEEFSGKFEVVFQNENTIAYHDGKAVAIVPDLIIVMDRETAEPLTTESIKYGQRVKVIGVSVPDIMATPEALAVFGPAAFGLEEKYQSIATLSMTLETAVDR